MALRVKLALLSGAIVLALAAAGSVLLYRAVEVGLFHSAYDTLLARLASVDAAVATAPDLQVGSGSESSYQQVGVGGLPVQVTAPRAPVALVQLLSPQGRLISSYGSAKPVLEINALGASGSVGLTKRISIGGEATPSFVAAVKSHALPGDYLVAASSGAPVARELAGLARWLLGLDLATATGAAAAGFVLASASLRPTARMREQAARMVSESYPGVLDETGEFRLRRLRPATDTRA